MPLTVREIAETREGLLVAISVAEHANEDYYPDLRAALDRLCDAALMCEAESASIGTAA